MIKIGEDEVKVELTHEQAGLIKILVSQPCANNMLTADQFELIKEFLDYAGQHHYIVSSFGREALAAYDAKWSIIETAELERLRNIEARVRQYCHDTLDCNVTQLGQHFCASKILEIMDGCGGEGCEK